jgi:carboxyl-terminal processing protease
MENRRNKKMICLLKKIRLFLITFLWIITITASAANTVDTTATGVPSADIQKLLNAIAVIKRYYVSPINDNELIDNAIRGMMSGLDPHSAYLGAQDLKDLNVIATGEFEGIGLTLAPEAGALRVVDTIEKSPAEKAGIRVGDLIVRIDSQLVSDLAPDKAISLMRGAKGSKVTVYLIRKPENKMLKFTITRGTIVLPTITSKLYDGIYGYIRIAIFQENTDKLTLNAIRDLQNQSHKNLCGLVIDVRNNPGGLLSSAVDTSDIFLDTDHLLGNNLVTYLKGFPNNKREDYLAKPNELLKNLPIVLLINENSASGAEILAGALQDHKRATIVGNRSFGKGSVQTVIPLDSASALKLTTALYYTPLGHSIQAKGIEPDVAVSTVRLDKIKNNGSEAAPLYEKDLQNHIQNNDNNSAPDKKPEKNNNLIYEDFQLYTALNILKAQVANNKN